MITILRNLSNSRPFTRLCLLTCVALQSTVCALVGLPGLAAKPNFILVFIDDMGWADFSCFGNTEAETPNIDRLAVEGIAFEQFYVNSPICSPSRVAISTGQYPYRWRINSYLATRSLNAERGIDNWLDPDAPLLARFLQGAGYATGHFGKWHMGGQRDVADAPHITDYGFDESLTNFEGLGPRVLPLRYEPGGRPPVPLNHRSHELGHGPVIWHDRAYITEKFTQAATNFARVAMTRNQPFYLNLWPDDVHTPVHPPLEKWGDGSKRHLYLKVLEAMDEQLGPLFDLVREHDRLRENTVILVCSDNGPEVGFGSAGPLRGHKATLFEGGVRSPLVVWAPGLMPEEARGTRNTQSVISAMDLVPSLMSLAGISTETTFDGENLLPTLLGRSTASRSAPLYFRRPPDRENFRHYVGLPDLAARTGKWKFYSDYDGGNPQLFDLRQDPSESEDVAGRNGEVVKKISTGLLTWNAAMPRDNGAEFRRGRR